MSGTERSAAGPAAGYHYQAQRALITLLNESPDSGRELAMETLDDLALSDPDSVIELQQLKHSVNSGTITDRSPSLWGALDNWMDYLGTPRIDQIYQMVLVSTDEVARDSAPALLREDDRQSHAAEERLLEAASEQPGNQRTKDARSRFANLSSRDRGTLLSKVIVRDGTAGLADFRSQLRNALRLALPRSGVEDFLDQLVGWWERRVVDLLIGRTESVSYDEAADEIGRLRDMYNDSTLPPPDPTLQASLSDALVAAYVEAPFVHQLQIVALRDDRIRLAIRDYHRAYAQRSSWLQEGILDVEELLEWERRLIDEWEHAWVRMLEAVEEADEDDVAQSGRALLGELEGSGTNPLRSGRDRFLHIGTLHGLADTRDIGWHKEFRARLEEAFGQERKTETSATFEEVGDSV